uniref:Ig-like domain-containing protein n=1 Tax=Electrophorus electricus TaxID=8005 RepID=A0AAY5EKM1_ELEEL
MLHHHFYSASVSMFCLPQPVIKWFRNGQQLMGGEPGVSILEDGTLLILASLSPLDNGEYTCMATNDAGSTQKKYQLRILYLSLPLVPPSIKGGNLTSEVTALLSNAITLKCEARGVPLPTITWHKDGEVILSSRHTQYVERGQLLRIPRVQASDAGRYTCKVTSLAGAAEKAYELDVYGERVLNISALSLSLSLSLSASLSSPISILRTRFTRSSPAI